MRAARRVGTGWGALPACLLFGVVASAQSPPAEEAAAPEPPPLDPVAAAYRHFAEGRLAQMERDFEAAIAAYQRAADLDPNGAGPLVALAELRLAAGDFEAAESAAEEAVARDPNAGRAHRLLGALHYQRARADGGREDLERAVASYEEAVRLDPDDLETRSRLARLLQPMGRIEDASTHLRELVQRAPDAFTELQELASLRLAAGDREQAFDFLLQSLRVEPRNPDARKMLDDLLREDIPGRTREEMLADVAELYGDAAARHPEDPDLALAHADILARTGQLEEAAAAFETLVARQPDSEIALMGLAMVRREQMRLEDAETALSRLVAKNGRSVPGRLALGGVFLAQCQYEKAVDQFESLAGLPMEDYGSGRRREVLGRLAQALEHLGRYDEALEVLEEAADLAGSSRAALSFQVAQVQNRLAAGDPQGAAGRIAGLKEEEAADPGLLALEARVLAAEGRLDAALGILQGLVSTYPTVAGARFALVRHHAEVGDIALAEAQTRDWLEENPADATFRFQLGALLEQQGRHEEAEVEFRRVIEAVPNHDLALNYLGYMLADRGDRLGESRDLIQRALDQDPYNGSYLDSLGWVQFRMGDVEEAEPNLLRAQRCMPRNSVVLDHLGDLYRAKGDSGQAVRFWKLALEHDGEGELEQDGVARKIEAAGHEPD